MTRVFLCGIAASLALSACAPAVPDSGGTVNSGTGVGFGDYNSYEARQARDAQLATGNRTTVLPPSEVQSARLDGSGNPIEDEAARVAAAQNSGVAPVEASPSNPAPQVVTNSAGLSGENDFQAVSAERSIKADAALIQQNRAQYQIIAPTELPNRPGTNTPNIVEYALRTTNPVGQPLYKRSNTSQARYQRNCGKYISADLAQEDFLSSGGPQKDRKGLDPDGDGFACTWDPAPFRAARNG